MNWALIATILLTMGVLAQAQDDSIHLMSKQAEVFGKADWVASPPVASDSVNARNLNGYLAMTHDTRLRWKAKVEPGVYNVMVRYDAPDSVPMILLQVSDGRELKITPLKSNAPKELGFHSLGPLAFDKARDDTGFELTLAPEASARTFALVELVLQPIGGTTVSIKNGELVNERADEAVTRDNPKDGAEMVLIPEGEFIMGGLSGKADAHRVSLKEFWMYKFPVTVKQYRQFCDETARQMPPPPGWGWIDDHPIVNVSWFDALAYAKWAAVRLPTEAEWEKAGRGTDGRVLPWGNDFDTAKCQSPRDKHGFQGTTPVGYFPGNVSPFGCRDMAGNVWQWCSTRIAPYPYHVDDGREEIATTLPDERRTYRGGGFVMNSWRMDWTILHRGNFFPKTPDADGVLVEVTRDHIGFRCAASAEPSPGRQPSIAPQ